MMNEALAFVCSTLAVFIKNNLLRKLQIYTKKIHFCLSDLSSRSSTRGCVRVDIGEWFGRALCCSRGFLFCVM